MDFIHFYTAVIVSERQWSWTVVGMIYLVGSLLSRSLFFRSLIRETKGIDSSLYSAVKQVYLKNSISGWILFSISFLLVIVAWLQWTSVVNDKTLFPFFCLLLPILFFLSVTLHLTAYVKALLAVLRQRMGVEKEF